MNQFFKFILPARTYERMRKSSLKKKGIAYYEVEKYENWKEYLGRPNVDPVLRDMMLAFEHNQSDALTSQYWLVLNRKNVIQLVEKGFENFKQTIALNYFVWLVDETHDYAQFLMSRLTPEELARAQRQVKTAPPMPFSNPKIRSSIIL